MNLEIVFLDHGVGPNACHQLAFSDKFPGPLDQRDQDVQRPAAEAYRHVALQQQ